MLLGGFEWPAVLKEAVTDLPDAQVVRVSRVRGASFATVTVLSADIDDPLPIVATCGDNKTSFGRNRHSVLTITAHDAEAVQLIAMLRNTADALERASEVAGQLRRTKVRDGGETTTAPDNPDSPDNEMRSRVRSRGLKNSMFIGFR